MKKFLSTILVLLLVLTQLPLTVLAKEDELDKSKLLPVFSIENTDIPQGDAGSTVSLSMNIKNTGYSAKDVIITPVFEGTSPFTVNNLTNSVTLPKINGNSTENIKISLSISPDAAPGNYPIKLSFRYKNSYDYEGTFEEVIYVRVTGKSTLPKLIIQKVTPNPEVVGPGENVKVNIMFENKGSIEAKDVTVKLEGLKNDGGLYIASGSDTEYINRVPGGSVSYVSFNLKAANNIKKGSHELDVSFSYGKDIKETQKIYINVGGKGGQSSNILIENLQYPTTAIKPNKDFVLKFDLRNNGSLEASNVLVKVESSDPAVVPKTASIKKINSIPANEKESLEFIFSPTPDATTKNYPINITIEYEDELNQGSENKYQLTQYVGVYVEKAGDDGKGKPKLIIDKYSFEPNIANAGENFVMNLSFYNTNSQKAVKNIKIFLTSDEKTDKESNSAGGSVFTPVDSSNTFYIDNIPPKGRVEKKITMFSVPDAQAKTYTLTANFEYEDSDGTEFTATELIGVPVVQKSKLESGELTYLPEAFVGQPTPISVEFYNTGKVTLYNMMVKLEGDFQTENGSYYVGNFNNGSSEFFEGMVIPNEAGELKGAVVFTYEDSSGKEQEVREEFTLNVAEMPPMNENPDDMPPMDDKKGGIKGLLKNKWLWISLVIIGGGAGGFVFYKKKKKKGMAIDE